jgi:hypothetical protein
MSRISFEPALTMKGQERFLAEVFRTEEEQRNRLLGAQLVLVGNIVNDATFGSPEDIDRAISKLESIVMGEMRLAGHAVLAEVKQLALQKLQEVMSQAKEGIVV